MLGHSNTRTTQLYAKVHQKAIKDSMNRACKTLVHRRLNKAIASSLSADRQAYYAIENKSFNSMKKFMRKQDDEDDEALTA
jgi:hypothetical protein